MKIAMIIVRTLMGLLFLFASISYFGGFMEEPELEGNMRVFNDGLKASLYILPVIKTLEFLCGLAFITGRYVTLAAVVIAPIIVNILCVHIFLDTAGLPVAIFAVLGNSFLAYYYRENYRSLFKAK